MNVMLYDLVKESHENQEAMQTLIDLFEPKLKKSLLMTKIGEREDLAQELKYTLIKYIQRYNVDSTPGFWELKKQVQSKKIS